MNDYKEIEGPVEGYKIFNNDLTCRGKQYYTDKINELDNNEPLELCGNGLHFCKYLSGVWAYYATGRVFKIRAYGVLVQDVTPGADCKLVARRIELVSEVIYTGNCNTGYYNTGDYNTGYYNTGDYNTGNYNTGNRNTGNRNTGDYNTGYYNTGDYNTGDYNTGNCNTGYYNTGDCNTGNRNTGYYNTGDSWSGYFNLGVGKKYLFNKVLKRVLTTNEKERLYQLYNLMLQDTPFDVTPFLDLPNATKAFLKRYHKEAIRLRKERENN